MPEENDPSSFQTPARDGQSPNISSIRKKLFDGQRPSPPKDPKLALQLGMSPQPQTSSGNWRRGYLDLIHTPPQSAGSYGSTDSCGNYSPITKSERRVRGPRMSLPKDAAGLQSAGPWKGRDVPRKGHGLPPPELNEPPFHRCPASTTNYHQYTRESPIVAFCHRSPHADPSAVPFAIRSRPSTASAKPNSSKQMAVVLHEYASKDENPESVDNGQPVLISPHRALGIGSPPPALGVSTKDRVLGTNAGLTEDDINPGLSESRRTAYGALRRPATASAATQSRSRSSANILKWSDPPVKDIPSAPRPRTKSRGDFDRALDTWRAREKKLQEKRLEDAPAVWCAANMDAVSNKNRAVSGSFVFG